jgi:hypothetical protein
MLSIRLERAMKRARNVIIMIDTIQAAIICTAYKEETLENTTKMHPSLPGSLVAWHLQGLSMRFHV